MTDKNVFAEDIGNNCDRIVAGNDRDTLRFAVAMGCCNVAIYIE